MKNIINGVIVFCVTTLTIHFVSPSAFSWSSATHLFIAKKAGVLNPQYSNFPDLSRNENPSLLRSLHWHNTSPSTIVTPDYIDQYQIAVR